MCARPSSAMLDPLRSIFPRESEFCVGRFARADPLPPVPWRLDPGGPIWILHFLHLCVESERVERLFDFPTRARFVAVCVAASDTVKGSHIQRSPLSMGALLSQRSGPE